MARQIDNLVAWFKLNNDVVDSSDSPTNGSWTGAAAYGTGKQFTNAASFDTTNKVTSAATLSVSSVSFWMNLDTNNTDLIDLTSAAKISIDASNLITSTGLTNVTTYVENAATTTAGIGNYINIVLTFDSISADAIAIGDGTDGLIGDVRFYSSSLTEQERFSIYNAGNGNLYNDFTRILYEITGTTDFDLASNSDIDINMDDKIDNHTFTVATPYPAEINDALYYYDYNSLNIISGIIKDINSGPVGKLLTVYNYEILLSEKIVDDVFENITFEALIQQLVETYTELTYVSTYVSGLTVTKYTSKNKTVRQVIRDLLKQLPGVTYKVSDIAKDFDMYEIDYSTSSETLTNGTNVNINGGWGQNSASQITRLRLVGENQSPNTQDTYVATAAQTDFVLSEVPVGNIKVQVNAVEKVLQVDGQNSGDYTLNRETKTVTFLAGLTVSDAVIIDYTFDVFINVEQDADVTIQDKYGIIEGTITRKFITTMEDARSYAVQYLTTFGTPLLSSNIVKVDNMLISNFRPGDQIRVVDSINEVDGSTIDDFYTIRSIKRVWASSSLVIEVGDEVNTPINFFQESQYNLKQLYEKDNNVTVFQKSQQLVNNVTLQFDNEVSDVQKRTFYSDSFYLEDDSVTRNQMRDDGSGAIMRDYGYTGTDLDNLNDDLVAQTGTDTIVAQNGTDNVVAQSSGDITAIGTIPSATQATAITDFLTALKPLVTHMGVGDGTSTPLITDTALENETYREAITASGPATVSSNFIFWDMKIDQAENNGNTQNEIATFDAASSGNAYTHSRLTTFDKTSAKVAYYQSILNVNTEVTNI